MNKTNYKNTFLKIHPSAVTVERIFDMAEKKQIKFCKKSILALIVIVSIFLATCICANAATDGALTDGVKSLLTGKTADAVEYVGKHESSYIDVEGNNVEKIVFETPDGQPGGEYVIYKSNSSPEFDQQVSYFLRTVDDSGNKILEIVVEQ